MGNLEPPQSIGTGMKSILPAGLHIVANGSDIAVLEANRHEPGLGTATMTALPVDADLPRDLRQDARVVVLEVDPASRASLRRLDALHVERPNMPVIAAVQNTDVRLVRSLIRSGVSDVVSLPFDVEELTSAILDAIAGAAAAQTEAGLAPMYALARCTGGCGATTVATHLAAEIAKLNTSEKDVCVFDLDLQGGEVATFVGARTKANFTDLVEAGNEIDDSIVCNAVSRTQYNFVVLAAPDEITPLDKINADQLLKILKIARRNFSHVLLDFPADWTDWSLSTALAASDVILITDLSISSLRQAKRRIDLLTSIGVPSSRLKVVVNRMQHRLFKTIGVEEVEEALGLGVLATLRDEGSNLRSAQDQGVLLSDVVGRSRFQKDVGGLARRLVHGEES